MKISASDWQNYIEKLSAINQKAGSLLKEYVDKHGIDDVESLITYAHALITKYGEAGSELACQMYDSLAQMQHASVPLAQPAPIANRREVAGTILKTKGTGNMIPSIIRLVKTSASDTMLKNAKRDEAEWAWVSKGDTCPYCMRLASLGWMPASEAIVKGNHADHIHANCDCEFAIRFDGESTVEGYDPERFKKIFDNAEGTSTKDKINYLRRENYQNAKEHQIDFMGKKVKTSILHINGEKEVFPIHEYSKASGFFTQTNSTNAQKTLSEVKEIIDNEKGDFKQVIVAKHESLQGLSAYDHKNNIIYFAEELADEKWLKEQVKDVFPARNLREIYIHESAHKEHWNAVNRFLKNRSGLDEISAKQELESDLRKYVTTQLVNYPKYIEENVSENANKGYLRKKTLNELIADVKVRIEQGTMEDEVLAKKVLEVLNYDA